MVLVLIGVTFIWTNSRDGDRRKEHQQ